MRSSKTVREGEEVEVKEMCQVSPQILRSCKDFFNPRSTAWVGGQILSGLLRNVNPLICIQNVVCICVCVY